MSTIHFAQVYICHKPPELSSPNNTHDVFCLCFIIKHRRCAAGWPPVGMSFQPQTAVGELQWFHPVEAEPDLQYIPHLR